MCKTKTEIAFPRFLSTKVCGEDKLNGSSHDKLANAIAKHFKETDSCNDSELPRIIGIEGEWGAGKSNVVDILKKKLGKSYYIYEYDAWRHQEDLQRRSLIENLTSTLINDNFLDKKRKVTDSMLDESESVTWEQKLRDLLANRKETVTKDIPEINTGAFITWLLIALTPVTVFVAQELDKKNTNLFCLTALAFSPILLGFICWGLYCFLNKEARHWGYILKISKNETTTNKNIVTINEDEPTTAKFTKWMSDLSQYIDDYKKGEKLVIVFDNMDRLPAEKVKSLWSSINTFFAGKGFDNIWVIIPFDRKHLSCAFGEGGNVVCLNGTELTIKENNACELTNLFIEKTFPIVYRVTPPIITDYKEIFNKYFVDAFGNTEVDSEEVVSRLYRIDNPQANIRDIIAFMNEMVSLKHQWGSEVSLISISLFCLKKDDILCDNTASKILAGEYIRKFDSIVKNDSDLQTEISVLVYGVDKSFAKQIPLEQYIRYSIGDNEKYDINTYSETNINFDSILDEVVKELDDANIDKLINCLSNLIRKNEKITKIWNHIADRKCSLPIEQQLLTNEYKSVLLNIDNKYQQKILDCLYNKVLNFKDFKGANYYRVLNEIESFIKENSLECRLKIKIKRLEPNIFIDYVNEAGDQYINYNVEADPAKLETYLIDALPDKLQYSEFPKIIKNDKKYNFSLFVKNIEDKIVNKQIKANNCASILLFYTNFCAVRPLPQKIDLYSVTTIYQQLSVSHQMSEADGFFDIFALYLLYGNNISFDDDKVAAIAERIDCYAKYGDVLITNNSWNFPYLNKILNYMTINNIGHGIQLENTLKLFEAIKTKINVSDEQLMNQIARLSESPNEVISEESLESIVPIDLYKVTTTVDNTLTQLINNTAINKLTNLTADILYNQRTYCTTYYWHVVANLLLSNGVLTKLPDCLSEFSLHILNDIGQGSQTLPLNSYFTLLISKLDKRKTSATVKDIRNIFCNGISEITSPKFIILEPWLREQGDLLARTEVADKIIRPIISNNECRKVILDNHEFYTTVINHCGDDANNLRSVILDLVNNSDDTAFKTFAESLGIEIVTSE